MFNVTADAYGRFMGQYAEPLAGPFLEFAGIRTGQRALDVGCGPGALTAQLVQRLGADDVAAVDPSGSFVEAVSARLPDVDVRKGSAEQLPFPDNSFDCALAQLVVHFMTDPVAGLREMARVVAPDGLVATCVWDHAGGGGPLTDFWHAVHDIDPDHPGEAELAGTREGHLAALSESAGLRDIESGKLTVEVGFTSFLQWWDPYTLGVGPAGAYVGQLDAARRDLLRGRCEQRLPQAPFTVRASAWCAKGRA